jgi:hypothetical protein
MAHYQYGLRGVFGCPERALQHYVRGADARVARLIAPMCSLCQMLMLPWSHWHSVQYLVSLLIESSRDQDWLDFA